MQGESSRAGIPTVFIRLSGCNLRCDYCDTKYAWEPGEQISLDEVLEKAESYGCKLVEITGGEPLAQPFTPELCEKLLFRGFTVMVETNGTIDISILPQKTVKILDMKCPASNESGKFLYGNLKHLSKNDELKFVVCSKEDFDWAIQEIEKNDLLSICPVNISPVAGLVDYSTAARWILESGKELRLNLQLHKIIWGDKRGV